MPVSPKNLTCPYCGSVVNPKLEEKWSGYGAGEHEVTVLTGFECGNDECDASWTDTGYAKRAPRQEFTF